MSFKATHKTTGDVIEYDTPLPLPEHLKLQAYVEFPTWKGRGEVATLKVKNTI